MCAFIPECIFLQCAVAVWSPRKASWDCSVTHEGRLCAGWELDCHFLLCKLNMLSRPCFICVFFFRPCIRTTSGCLWSSLYLGNKTTESSKKKAEFIVQRKKTHVQNQSTQIYMHFWVWRFLFSSPRWWFDPVLLALIAEPCLCCVEPFPWINSSPLLH